MLPTPCKIGGFMVSKAWSLRGHSSGSKSQSIIRVNLKTQALDHCSTAEIHFYEARGPAFKFLQAYYFRNTLRRPLLASALVKRRVFEGRAPPHPHPRHAPHTSGSQVLAPAEMGWRLRPQTRPES